MKNKARIAISSCALFLASCENPADKTTSAKVGEAVETSSAPAPSGGVKYAFTPESEILFTGSKVTGSHSGGFKSFTGGFTVVGDTLAGSGHRVTIDMNSIWSDNDKLTEHLKNEDFLNVPKYPVTSFELTGLDKLGDGRFEVSGNLTLNGTSKNITFPASAELSEEKAKIHAKFDINRKDFGIVYAGKADDLIRDEVVIELKLTAVPQS